VNGFEAMSNAFNNKRVFLVVPHVPAGYLDIVGKRDDVRLDKLDNGKASETAKSILAAAHAYQTSSTRDELVRHYHTGAELLQHTPNLLIVSTNGAGYDTVDVKACSEHGILVVNQAGGNAESVAEHVLGMLLSLENLGVRLVLGHYFLQVTIFLAQLGELADILDGLRLPEQ